MEERGREGVEEERERNEERKKKKGLSAKELSSVHVNGENSPVPRSTDLNPLLLLGEGEGGIRSIHTTCLFQLITAQ
jgi:hypothetical protein